jgi:two-component SAPR family response regulator
MELEAVGFSERLVQFYHKTVFQLINALKTLNLRLAAISYSENYTLYVEIKCQLDARDVFLLQILLLAQHV